MSASNVVGNVMRQKMLKAEVAKQSAAKQTKEELKAADHAAFLNNQAATHAVRPGMALSEQTSYEKKAGVDPVNYEGTRDSQTGALLDAYKINPYYGEAQQALKEQAFSQGESPWAKMQLQKQTLEQTNGLDNAAKAQAQMLAQSQGNLMRTGGLSNAARARMAMQSTKDAAKAAQDVYRQGEVDRLNIGSQDIQRKDDLLKNFANAETGAATQNLNTATGDMSNKAQFDMERYKQQMQAWGANKTAQAQAAASGGGKK